MLHRVGLYRVWWWKRWCGEVWEKCCTGPAGIAGDTASWYNDVRRAKVHSITVPFPTSLLSLSLPISQEGIFLTKTSLPFAGHTDWHGGHLPGQFVIFWSAILVLRYEITCHSLYGGGSISLAVFKFSFSSWEVQINGARKSSTHWGMFPAPTSEDVIGHWAR